MSITVSGATAYLGARLGGEAYTEETETRKSQALTSAQDILSGYLSDVGSEAGEHAVYEQALWLLGSRAEMQAQGVASFSLSGISESYDLKGRPANVAPAAWRIIKEARSGGASGGIGGPVWL